MREPTMLSEIINIVFCATIVIIGGLIVKKNKNMTAILLTMAFFLFGLSHLIAFFSTALAASNFFIITRVLAYAAIIFILYSISCKDTKAEK
jgi:hypothetical protein